MMQCVYSPIINQQSIFRDKRKVLRRLSDSFLLKNNKSYFICTTLYFELTSNPNDYLVDMLTLRYWR